MALSTLLDTGAAVRLAAREGTLTGPTTGLAPGYVQTNLVIVPAAYAADFADFCERNPRPCPVIGRTEPGAWRADHLAAYLDLRYDVPRYRVWRDGVLTDEPTEIADLWQPDFVSFLLGCSFTFEHVLQAAGLSIRHIDLGCNVPMYRTNQECVPVGPFAGPVVVSMRPFKPADAVRAIELTSPHPRAHGAPVHLGFPDQLGIADLQQPDYGDAVPVEPGEIPLFWACGVTPQAALVNARLPLAITHAPGSMLVTDIRM